LNLGCGDTRTSLLTVDAIRECSDEDKRCFNELVLHVATNTPTPERWPCTIAPDGGIYSSDARR
jgi:hypothetical protein